MMKTRLWITGMALLFTGCSHAQTNPVAYPALKAAIITQQQTFKAQYQAADANDKTLVLNEARLYVFEKIRGDIFDAWYGTPWTFEGHTTIPRQGSVACGYFVTTVLQDAGFKIPRVQWAQLASEYIILNMTDDVKRFSNKPVEDVAVYIKQKGDGLYIVGLDLHVGFIYKSGETIRFVHSNYYEPDTGVMAQELYGDNPLANSGYRVIGKILDDMMMEKWILGSVFE